MEDLSDSEVVIRLLRADSSDGTVTYNDFLLSNDDKKEIPHSLSVWASRLTKPIEAQSFMEARREYFADFTVLEIKRLEPFPANPKIVPLNVVWQPLPDDQRLDESGAERPGAAGHSGIIGWDAGRDVTNGGRKDAMLSLRIQLAELATLRRKPITSD